MTKGFNWQNVYPKAKIITLVLNADDSERFIKAASFEGRKIAADTFRGMPSIAFGAASVALVKAERPAEQVETSPEIKTVEQNAPARPSAEVVILPVVRREKIPPKTEIASTGLSLSKERTFRGERPPAAEIVEKEPSRKWNKARGKLVFKGEITIADKLMVAEAIAKGFPVTKCPPHKYSVEIGQPDAGMGGVYSRTKARKQRIEAHAERRKQRQLAHINNEISP